MSESSAAEGAPLSRHAYVYSEKQYVCIVHDTATGSTVVNYSNKALDYIREFNEYVSLTVCTCCPQYGLVARIVAGWWRRRRLVCFVIVYLL